MTDARKFVELRELELGQRFMFYADDLERRGPCTLLAKYSGAAWIKYEPRTITKTIKSRDPKTGEMVEKTFTQIVSGEERCALGAQVVALVTVREAVRQMATEGLKEAGDVSPA